jgi:hypothetical protein
MPNKMYKKFLTRGGTSVGNDTILVGHTLKRGWSDKYSFSVIRKYNSKGKSLNDSITLQGVVGIYDIISF